jgi:hypothetical protein
VLRPPAVNASATKRASSSSGAFVPAIGGIVRTPICSSVAHNQRSANPRVKNPAPAPRRRGEPAERLDDTPRPVAKQGVWVHQRDVHAGSGEIVQRQERLEAPYASTDDHHAHTAGGRC